MKRRGFQEKLVEIARDIIAGRNEKKCIVGDICPSAGKTKGGSMFCHELLRADKADLVLWASPKNELQRQIILGFHDPSFGLTFRLKKPHNGKRDLDTDGEDVVGLSTTIQAIFADVEKYIKLLEGRRPILVMDEAHHFSRDSAWFARLQTLFDMVLATGWMLPLSGTFGRHDGAEVPLAAYSRITGIPVMVRDVIYTRKDALKDGATVPVEFNTYDGNVRYSDGYRSLERKVEAVEKKQRKKALRAALATEYGEELVGKAMLSFADARNGKMPWAKCIVVCTNIDEAMDIKPVLEGFGAFPVVATSDDDKQSAINIEQFRRPNLKGAPDTLVCVDKASEGLDVPEISHVLLLTIKRSFVYVAQAVARGTRTFPGKLVCRVYGPNDAEMVVIKNAFDEENSPTIKEAIERDNAVIRERAARSSSFAPDSSELTGEHVGEPGISLTREQLDMVAVHREETGSTYDGASDTSVWCAIERAERRRALHTKARELIKTAARSLRRTSSDFAADIERHFNKRLSRMVLAELHDVVDYVREITNAIEPAE